MSQWPSARLVSPPLLFHFLSFQDLSLTVGFRQGSTQNCHYCAVPCQVPLPPQFPPMLCRGFRPWPPPPPHGEARPLGVVPGVNPWKKSVCSPALWALGATADRPGLVSSVAPGPSASNRNRGPRASGASSASLKPSSSRLIQGLTAPDVDPLPLLISGSAAVSLQPG